MDKKFKIASLVMTCLLLIISLFLITACDNGDELSTDQMTDTGITVKPSTQSRLAWRRTMICRDKCG